MINSMVKSMVSSMVKSMVNPSSSTERIFIELDPVLNSYYSYATELVFFSGDTFEFEFLGKANANTFYLSDSSVVNDRGYVLVESFDGLLDPNSTIGTMILDGVSVPLVGTAYPTDDKLHTMKLIFNAKAMIKFIGSRFTIEEFYDGIIANTKATISSVTTTHSLDLATGNSEQSTESSNILTYVNIPDTNRELFRLSADNTQWNNISPPTQVLPAVIEVA